MKHRLTLDYTIPTGDLAPYFEALQLGKALASHCRTCGGVAFPARTHCAHCGAGGMRWQPLTGLARVVLRSEGPSGCFALVQFDGASTCSTVAILNPEQETLFGYLTAPIGDAPGLWLKLTDEIGGDDDGRYSI